MVVKRVHHLTTVGAVDSIELLEAPALKFIVGLHGMLWRRSTTSRTHHDEENERERFHASKVDFSHGAVQYRLLLT